MNKGITKREREVTDMQEIISILDKAKVLHLGLVDGDEPYVVPMNYGYTMEDGKMTVYLHGALQGRKLDVMRVNPKVFFELDCDIVPFEGKTACNYGITYASVICSASRWAHSRWARRGAGSDRTGLHDALWAAGRWWAPPHAGLPP